MVKVFLVVGFVSGRSGIDDEVYFVLGVLELVVEKVEDDFFVLVFFLLVVM